jgi:hypothetical protein
VAAKTTELLLLSSARLPIDRVGGCTSIKNLRKELAAGSILDISEYSSKHAVFLASMTRELRIGMGALENQKSRIQEC